MGSSVPLLPDFSLHSGVTRPARLLWMVLCLVTVFVAGCKEDAPVEPPAWNGPRFSYPIAVGTVWTYSYDSFDSSVGNGTGTNESYSSTRVWEVIRHEETTSGLLVVVKSTALGQKKFVKSYYQWNLVSSDSTSYPDTWTVFGILVGSETITPDWASTVGRAGGLPAAFSRRLSKPRDTLVVTGNGGNAQVTYVDSVGLTAYGNGHSSMGSGYGEYLKLSSMALPPR